ncbi:carboxypeptidase regulatory-like domain-containing protein, partial [Sporomusa sp.]|uniref:carboxypeptidase regulatory-like domain-containing protein n=1 Tax=Sporomusa sp. TaxID=2078658 RepID=UPI002BF73F36
MILVRQVQKKLANSLVWLLVLTNLVLPAAQAANPAEKTAVTQEQAASQDGTIVLELDKSQTPQTALATTTVEAASKNKTTDQDKVFQFGNQLLSYYLQEGKSAGPEWLKTTALNFYISKDFKQTYSLETIQPFGERNNNPGDHWFWQGRYARSEDASTFNFGAGWRNLAPDRQSLLGMNLFYDYGFKYNLARIGLGGEYFNKLSEYRFNVYHPVTGDKLANVNYQTNGILYSYIRAVDGVDLELGTSFSHAPWLKAFLKGYYYDNQHKDDELGYQLRTTMQVSPRFNLELGYRYSNLNHDPYAIVTYQLADTMPLNKGKAKKDGPYDLSDKLLQLVERENDIKTETWTKFVAYRGSIKTTVTNSNNNTAIAGAIVQAYQNNAAVGSAVVTDDSGTATISGLAVGSYTVYVTYGSYSETSDAIMVVKDITVPANVSLDVVGGSVKVTVLDVHSVGISSATVVATESSSPTVAYAPKNLVDVLLGVKTAYAGSSALSLSMTTNANGIATFTNLPPGTYTFTVTYMGNSMTSEAVSITAGSTNDATILLPASGGNIRAVVTDDNGTALSGATVAVLSGTTTVATGTTGTSGVALIGGLAAGSYTVSASLADYTAGSTSGVEISEGKTSTSSLILTRQRGSVTV